MTITQADSPVADAETQLLLEHCTSVAGELVETYRLEGPRKFVVPPVASFPTRLNWGSYSRVVTDIIARFRQTESHKGALNAASIAEMDTTGLPMDRIRQLIANTNGPSQSPYANTTQRQAAEIILAMILVEVERR